MQTTEWEFHKLFDGISDDKIEAMTLQEFERHQDERMKLNAYMVRDEVVKRIDGAPCLKEQIVAYPSPDDSFFFNKAEIYKHHTALKSVQSALSDLLTTFATHGTFSAQVRSVDSF